MARKKIRKIKKPLKKADNTNNLNITIVSIMIVSAISLIALYSFGMMSVAAAQLALGCYLGVVAILTGIYLIISEERHYKALAQALREYAALCTEQDSDWRQIRQQGEELEIAYRELLAEIQSYAMQRPKLERQELPLEREADTEHKTLEKTFQEKMLDIQLQVQHYPVLDSKAQNLTIPHIRGVIHNRIIYHRQLMNSMNTVLQAQRYQYEETYASYQAIKLELDAIESSGATPKPFIRQWRPAQVKSLEVSHSEQTKTVNSKKTN